LRSTLRAYPRILWILAFAGVILAYGESFFWPLTMTYITTAFEQSMTVAATVLILQYAASLVGNMVGGWLFDRWSGRRLVQLSCLAMISLLIAMGATTSFPLYIALLTAIGLIQGMLYPSLRALATVLWPEGGRRAINALYVANNLGVALGAASGGLVASLSFEAAFYSDAAAYVIYLLIFSLAVTEAHFRQKGPRATPAPDTATSSAQLAHPTVPRSTWTSLGLLSVGLTLLVVTYMQWQTTMPGHLKTLGIPLDQYTILWTVNGLVIVLGQPLLAWFIHRYARTLRAQVLAGSLLFVAAGLLTVQATSFPWFVLGMIVITLGEMLVWPGVPAIAAELAPAGREGFFQGIAATGQSAGRMIGPLIGSTLYEWGSAGTLFGGMTALSLLALLALTAAARTPRQTKNIAC